MAKGGNKGSLHIGHIKQSTVGTSNEVSFSVLDARSSLAGAKEAASKEHAFGVRLFTLPGKKTVNTTPAKEEGVFLKSGEFVSVEPSTSTRQLAALQIESSDDYARSRGKHGASSGSSLSEEAKSRKRARRLRRFGVVAAVAVVAAGLLVLTSHFMQDRMHTQQTQSRSLQVALEDIIRVDSTLVLMDDVLSNPIDTGSFDKMNEVQVNTDSAFHYLGEAEAIINGLAGEMVSAADRDAADAALRAVAARREMLEAGITLMDLSHDAAQAIALTASGWNKIFAADSLAREAAQQVTLNTAEGVQVSRDKAAAAIDALSDARAGYAQCVRLYPDMGYETLLAYADKRLEALEHGLASSEALLANSPDVAAAENAAYNEAEAQAAELSTQLPTDLEEAVRARYAEESADPSAAYQDARTAAAASDSFLRNYLATSNS